MNDPTPDVKIDKPGIVQQITDHVVTELVSALMPDDKSRKLVSGMMKIHRKYGIDSTTSLKILMDLAELTKED